MPEPETERGVQTYSMSDNKVSPSQEGCWLSSRVRRIETKVAGLWFARGTRESGRPDGGATFATRAAICRRRAAGLVARLARRGSINRPGPKGERQKWEHTCYRSVFSFPLDVVQIGLTSTLQLCTSSLTLR